MANELAAIPAIDALRDAIAEFEAGFNFDRSGVPIDAVDIEHFRKGLAILKLLASAQAGTRAADQATGELLEALKGARVEGFWSLDGKRSTHWVVYVPIKETERALSIAMKRAQVTYAIARASAPAYTEIAGLLQTCKDAIARLRAQGADCNLIRSVIDELEAVHHD